METKTGIGAAVERLEDERFLTGREVMAATLGIPELDLRVISPDVGGAFGMKSQIYPDGFA